jgi:hypothetical protein
MMPAPADDMILPLAHPLIATSKEKVESIIKASIPDLFAISAPPAAVDEASRYREKHILVRPFLYSCSYRRLTTSLFALDRTI